MMANRGWRRLVSPHPAIRTPDERGKAQLIIALSLACLLLSLAGILILGLGAARGGGLSYWGLWVLPVVLVGVYALSLSRHYQRAIWLLLAGLLLFPPYLALIRTSSLPLARPDLFVWAMLALSLAILLLTWRQLAIYTGLALLELLVGLLLLPRAPIGTATIYPALLSAVLVLFLLGLRYRSSNEAAQRAALQEANHLLQLRSRDLEMALAQQVANPGNHDPALRAVAEESPLAMMRFDRELRVLYANPAARRIFSTPDAELPAGVPLMEYPFAPEIAPVAGFLAASLLKVFESGRDTRTQSANGEREFDWRLILEHDPRNGGQSVFVTGMDVSEQRQVERRLVESEARFRALSEASPMGIYVDSPGGTCLYYNPMFQSITGLSEDEITSGWREQIIHPDDQERLVNVRAQMLSKSPYTFESVHRFLRADGRTVWVNSKETPMWDGGNLIGFLGLVEDITAKIEEMNARLESEESLRHRSEELETALRELEGFTYTVAHDLRAPLRAIDGFANILQREYRALLPQDGLRLLDTIRNSAQQMGHLIDDLLSFSRLGRQALSLQMVDMYELVDQVMETFADERKSRGIKVSVAPLEMCYGDPTLLRQVWVNLISNAVKFTRPVQDPQIEIGCAPASGGQVEYFVRDNGAGFDMAFSSKLFGVFQRLHRPDEFEGTGVGLAIVQRIVLRHEGKVWAKGAPGQGATFFFSLPTQPSQQPEIISNAVG